MTPPIPRRQPAKSTLGVSLHTQQVAKELSLLDVQASFPTDIEDKDLGAPDVFDTAECTKLGLSFRPLRETLRDLVESLDNLGLLHPSDQ